MMKRGFFFLLPICLCLRLSKLMACYGIILFYQYYLSFFGSSSAPSLAGSSEKLRNRNLTKINQKSYKLENSIIIIYPPGLHCKPGILFLDSFINFLFIPC